METVRPSLYRRLTGSMPVLVSVGLHAVLIAAAAVLVVSETIVGKKKRFEAPPPADTAPRKQVEHRLQVARKGGATSSSPAASARILTTASGALALPPMPALATPGASGLGGFGGFGAGLGLGAGGGGLGTSLGSANLGGRGFMSLSFLGLSNVRAQKVVFVVDVGRSLMDIRKGGFQAFGIIRTEIMKLIGNLPPSSEFGVVLFDGMKLNPYADRLQLATVKNKTTFFDWMGPINTKLDALGIAYTGGGTAWTAVAPEGSAIDPGYSPSPWVQAVHAGLQLKPDTVFVITGAAGYGSKRMGEGELQGRRRSRERDLEALRREGLDLKEVTKARLAALAKARKELEAINRRLIAERRDPFIVTETRRILDADFQAALARAGVAITMDLTGWSDRAGKPVWVDPDARLSEVEPAALNDAQAFVGALANAFTRDRLALNLFLFAGPDDRPQAAMDGLTQVARRHGGRFELLTTRRLEELTAP